ncbi:MAG: hypothetical protein HYT22_04085 [Candidatus Niyogibacteria bacterium]|nr:hypothetical protein [Candidatus Niyogibacteria bacterium]
MGNQIVLEEWKQIPFRLGLKKLRRHLSDAVKFEELVQRGLRTVSVVADHWQKPRFARLFDSPSFHGWVAENQNRSEFFAEFTPPDEREPEVRRALKLLRQTVCNKARLARLAEIGPCALHLWDPSDPKPELFLSILVTNYLPDRAPNADHYSIGPKGLRFHG